MDGRDWVLPFEYDPNTDVYHISVAPLGDSRNFFLCGNYRLRGGKLAFEDELDRIEICPECHWRGIKRGLEGV